MGFTGGASGIEPSCQGRRPKRREFDPWVRNGLCLQRSELPRAMTEGYKLIKGRMGMSTDVPRKSQFTTSTLPSKKEEI